MSSTSQEEKVMNKSENIQVAGVPAPQGKNEKQKVAQGIMMGGVQQNIENANIKQENTAKSQEDGDKQIKSIVISKLIFVSLTLLQFSNLLALILIQYISSKVYLSLFLVLLIFATAIHLLLVGIVCRIKMVRVNDCKRNFSIKQSLTANSKNNKKETHISTLPKINFHIRKKSLGKTKKLQYPHSNNQYQQNTQQTIKRESATIKQFIIRQQRVQQQISQQCAGWQIYALVCVKSIQVILLLVYPTFSLVHLYQSRDGQIIALSIIAYVLLGLSLISFAILLKDIRCFFQIKIVNEYIMQATRQKSKQQIKSKISIDHLIQLKNDQGKSILSINQMLRSSQVDHQECNSRAQNLKQDAKQKIVEQTVYVRKTQIKKSVLKSSKYHEPKVKKANQEEVMQRRKVEINSKKIQYFQYLQNTPPHSVDEIEKEPNITPQKVNKKRNKMRYFKKKIEDQAQFLKRKKMNREKKARSSTYLYNIYKQEIVQLSPSKQTNQAKLLNRSLSL